MSGETNSETKTAAYLEDWIERAIEAGFPNVIEGIEKASEAAELAGIDLFTALELLLDTWNGMPEGYREQASRADSTQGAGHSEQDSGPSVSGDQVEGIPDHG